MPLRSGKHSGRHLVQATSGTTIVEAFVVMCILMLVSMAGFRFFQSVNKTQKNFSQQVQLQMESRKAFDQVVDQIREGTDVVRPVIGETLPYLVFKDIVNQTTMLYLEPNDEMSKKLKQRVYRLISYRTDYSGSYKSDLEKPLMESVKRMRFSCLSPNSVQVNATIITEKGEYQFLAHVGLMNLGGFE